MMTRKHFEALAQALEEARPRHPSELDTRMYGPEAAWKLEQIAEAEYRGWREAVLAVANVCSEENALFDGDYFLKACGDKTRRAHGPKTSSGSATA